MKKLKSFAMSLKIRIKLAFLILSVVILMVPSLVHAETITIKKPDVKVSANIGEPRLTIFGYTSPGARVTLEGQGIFDETVADENGYFIFMNRFAPLSRREICLTAYDDHGGSSQPVCLPPLPANRQVTIGPIILPPIIYMNQGGYSVNDFAIVQGSTVPNTDVSINFFSSNLEENTTSGVSLPKLHTQSDKNGSFNITLPTNFDQRLRFFAQTTFDDIDSGKSTTLTIDIEPLWMKILKLLFGFLKPLKDMFIYLLLLGEMGFLIWFFFVRKKSKHELMIRDEHPLVTQSIASVDR